MTDYTELLRALRDLPPMLREAADAIEALQAECERLRAELAVWKSVFPDIAPEQVLPDRSTLDAEIARMRKAAKDLTEIVRMPNAEHVADAHNAAVRLLKENRDDH